MIDTIIALFKFAGLILSCVFGIFGLTVEFKDKKGRITRAGRRALILIVAGSVIAVMAQALELIRAKNESIATSLRQSKDALEAAQRTEKLISEINRGLQPFRDVRLSYWIIVPMDHVKLKDYLERFNREVAEVVPILNADAKQSSGVLRTLDAFPSVLDAERNVEELSIRGGSRLAPKKDTEKLAYNILNYSEVQLEFFRTPIAVKDYSASGVTANVRPDLTVSVSGELNDKPSNAHWVEYALKPQRFRLRAQEVPSESEYWESTGRIVGVSDLSGAQMFVSLPSTMISGDATVDQYVKEIRKRFELDILILSVSGGRKFWFTDKELIKHYDHNGFPFYEYKFSKEPDGLAALQR